MDKFFKTISEWKWFVFASECILVLLCLCLIGIWRFVPISVFLLCWLIVATLYIDQVKDFWKSLEKPWYQLNFLIYFIPLTVIVIIWQVHTFYPDPYNPEKSRISQEPWAYLLVALTGLASTIFGVSVKEVFEEPMKRWLEGTKREEFLDFFGRSCKDQGITLVNARRELDRARLMHALEQTAIGYDNSLKQSVEEIVNDFSDYPFVFPDGLPAEVLQTHPEGVTSWVAYQDVQSAAHLAQLLALFGIERQIKFELDVDQAPRGWNISQISFGLGYNVMTKVVQKQFDKRPRGKEQVQALPFEVDYKNKSQASGDDDKHNSQARSDFRFNTDNIVWQGKLLTPPPNRDYAIIVRLVHGDPNYATFICAGRTAWGTTAAGMYLAEHWKDGLWEEYKKRIKDNVKIDGQEVQFHTHSLFVVIEHATEIPHVGQIAEAPWDQKEKLIHFQVSHFTQFRPK